MTVFRADRPGIALLVVVLLTMVVAAIAAGAALIGANAFLISEYDQKTSLLQSVANAGLELGRARLNSDPALFPPDSGYATLESGAAVQDAAGNIIPDVTRSLYAGPIGGGPGEYGTFGAIVAVAEDADGVKAVRRLDLLQESFAVYGYFTDYESSEIAFGNGDQLHGRVHSNSDIKVRSTGATFHGPVTTAGVFQGAEYATFNDDTTSAVTRIRMPASAQLTQLQARATPGHMTFTAPAGGRAGQSKMRLEFVSRDVGGEMVGFVRVYTADDTAWVTANVPTGGDMLDARNCGHFHADGLFYNHSGDDSQQLSSLKSSSRRCYLGGADSLFGGTFTPSDSRGAWLPYPGTVAAAVTASQPDANYLFPLDRRYNPGFRGVIHVTGKVVVSGTVRGRLTLAATGNIIIGDDIRYETDPSSGTCEDMLGLFSATQIIMADNMINAPRQPASGESYYTYDDSADEYIHGSLLALDRFTAENYGSGSTSAEPCNSSTVGRGCLYVTGGLIQQTRGAVSSGGAGYAKRYSHDTCAFTDPPPYFPTTGHFWRSRYYEVDPTGFDVAAYFRALN